MSALSAVTSIKTKLGLLVAASVVVAAVVGAAGGVAQVSWWIVLPVTVLLALTVTQLLAAGMVAPLRDMTAAASAMSAGDLSRRVHTDNTDEVGQLARAFNRMAEDLAVVDAERRDLIATVSHELRTPVTAMTAQLENLADGVVEATPERIAQVLSAAERLGDLVSDLLTLSRLEAGVVDLAVIPVELKALVEQCAAEVRRSGRGAEVHVEFDDDLVVHADPARLRQVIINALDNAARHTLGDTPVRVLAGTDASGPDVGQPGAQPGVQPGVQLTWIEVRDGGAGVASHDRERVFERFGTDAGGGTGLGLAIARWVATLHGGTLAFVDPVEGESGARLRLELPALPATAGQNGATSPSRPLSVTAQAATDAPSGRTTAPAPGPLDGIWPSRDDRPRPGLLVATALVALCGAAWMTFHGPGLAWTAVLVAAGAVAWSASPHRRSPFTLTTSLLALGLVAVMAWSDNAALGLMGVIAASGVFLAGLTRARTFIGILVSGLAWPLSSLRGLPWFGRSLGVVGRAGALPGVARTVGLSLLALAVFVALFAGADPTFARWIDAFVPDLSLGDGVLRLFVGGFVFATTLAAVHLAVNPPDSDVFARVPVRAASRWEWLVPVLVVDAVFLLFLASQIRVVTAGDQWLRETAGMTYADYVHQGFGQLVVATLLTLVVVWAASRRASLRPQDRPWMLASCGLLGLAAIGVVATAVGRMRVYEDAYGHTVMRLLVTVFEGWLGVVLASVLLLGLLRRGAWVPRVALLSGAAALLTLLLVRPDAVVAQRNVDRFEATGELDVLHLSGLSRDAVPAVTRLPEPVALCVVELSDWGRGDFAVPTLADWNLTATRVDADLAALRENAVRTQGDQGSACGALPGGDDVVAGVATLQLTQQ
ncbi:DUF4153 domain-containing protein [Nocardioides yefusunii]|uniref:Signal transduction histidine-protein kinase/phosphatase MprB n=1 Tax=Nocardioides yefusunii TaxID=2500546 RepID=A0ABW1QWB3_9ACTN|nr:DUF4153 domain-containing protein [Nocardioides yefusunii]